MAEHPDSALFPACPFAGRLRANVGDRFCRDPDKGRPLVRLSHCLACPLAGSVAPAPPRRPRVGDVLADLLKRRYGAVATSGCDCAGRIRDMNDWGPAGCRAELETIVGWLLEAAAKADAEAERALAENPELAAADDDAAGRRLRALAPDAAKRWKLRRVVLEAIRTVEDWTPAAAAAVDLAAA